MHIPTLNKKKKMAVSELIGYILLITFAIVIAGVVFAWLKTYVPKEGLACPDSVSIYVSDYNFDKSLKELSLTLKNNGQFSVGGIFIYYSTDKTQEIAINDLSSEISSDSGIKMNPGVRFGIDPENLNPFEPGYDKEIIFNIAGIDKIYAVEITPIRWQEEKTKIRVVSCANAKTKKILDLDINQNTIPPILIPINKV